MNPLLHRKARSRPIGYRRLTGALFVDRQTGGAATGARAIAEAIRATDIRQGELGNCHFLAAVGAVARRAPERLAARFTASDAQGCTVALFQSAWGASLGPLRSVPLLRELGRARDRTEAVSVQFEFPLFLDTLTPAFVQPYVARHGLTELWLLALEKAYAHYHRAYFLAQVGLGANALGLLTGAAVRLREPSMFGEEALRQALAEGEMVLATTLPNVLLGGRFELPPLHPGRLVPIHVYEVIAAHPHTFVLRNPHGPELDVEISFEDLCRYFLSLALCAL